MDLWLLYKEWVISVIIFNLNQMEISEELNAIDKDIDQEKKLYIHPLSLELIYRGCPTGH